MILYCKAILGRGKPGIMRRLTFVMNHAPGAGSIARPVDQQHLYHRTLFLDVLRLPRHFTTIFCVLE